MNQPGFSFDIFCRVVDNFGDIGVCWRLAKQLAQHTSPGQVRLWVDDLNSFARIERKLCASLPIQTVESVEIVHWVEPAPALAPHDIVIEAFACSPPADFIERMKRRNSLWINLEYLSAEDWVQSCHGLPSLQANGLQKYFFFPGFSDQTGGLLREPNLAVKRMQWLADPKLRWQQLHGIGMPDALISKLQAGWRQAFVFCYANGPVQALARNLEKKQPTIIIVPQGVYPGLLQMQSETLQVFESPFVDQDGFDQLLWGSDLNIVRGEDSLVRAIWAGRPFVWHIYQQAEGAHLIKLDAWLAQTGFSAPVRALMTAWNTEDEISVSEELSRLLEPHPWQQWRQDSIAISAKQAAQNSLTERLLAFCAEKAQTG